MNESVYYLLFLLYELIPLENLTINGLKSQKPNAKNEIIILIIVVEI